MKAKDWTGQKNCGLTFIRPADQRDGGHIVWEGLCECGKTYYVVPYRIRIGSPNLCECQLTKNGPRCSYCKKFGQEMKAKKTCKACSEHHKLYYKNNKDKIIASTAKWSKEHPEQMSKSRKKWSDNNKQLQKEINDKWNRTPNGRFSSAKSYAKRRNLEFSLTRDEYISLIRNPCHYCKGFLGTVINGIGLDRVSNDKGYVNDNVVSCCGWCNRIKSDWMTIEEALAAVKAVLKVRGIDI